jgi:hypothetical protein
VELDLASRQPLEIVQARDGLATRAVDLMLLVEVNHGVRSGVMSPRRASGLILGQAMTR